MERKLWSDGRLGNNRTSHNSALSQKATDGAALPPGPRRSRWVSLDRGGRAPHHSSPYTMDARRSLRLFITTLTELKAMAALARTGLSIRPVNGYKAPAATGMPTTL